MTKNKGSLSLNTVGTLIIALTVIAVGSLLIVDFSTPLKLLDEKTHSTIADSLSQLFGGKSNDVKLLTGEFKAIRIAKMVRKCWRGNRDESKICYVLRGKISANKEDVRGRLSSYVNERLQINSSLSSSPVTIKYNKPQNLIIVD